MLTAATTREIPPMAMMNVVTVPRVEVVVASRDSASRIRIAGLLAFVLILASIAVSISGMLSVSFTMILTWLYSSFPPYWVVYHLLLTTMALSVDTPSATVPRGLRTPAIRSWGRLEEETEPILIRSPTVTPKFEAIDDPTRTSFTPRFVVPCP